jgi:hypothetical protein
MKPLSIPRVTIGEENMQKRLIVSVFLVSLLGCSSQRMQLSLDLDRLSDGDIKRVNAILKNLEPIIENRKKEETHVLIACSELCSYLSLDQKYFLKSLRDLNPASVGVKIPYRGFATGKEEMIPLKNQVVRVRGKNELYHIPTQYLPRNIFDRYSEMMTAMQSQIGKRLYVESGYRSAAYQLYLFVFYLPKHHYSIRETAKFVAFPGYSEHGYPPRQAMDFINADGINGEDDPSEFANLPEYHWLIKNAETYGFRLSYPKDSKEGISFEPWHWRFEGK